MAGIGFELRKILRRDSLTGTMTAYGYAGLISAGPLILSIVAILLIGVLSLPVMRSPERIVQFQMSVTYLIAVSLIVTGADNCGDLSQRQGITVDIARIRHLYLPC